MTRAVLVALALTVALTIGYGAGRAVHAVGARVCALTTTVDDVGWRDAQGHTHDYLPRCK